MEFSTIGWLAAAIQFLFAGTAVRNRRWFEALYAAAYGSVFALFAAGQASKRGTLVLALAIVGLASLLAHLVHDHRRRRSKDQPG